MIDFRVTLNFDQGFSKQSKFWNSQSPIIKPYNILVFGVVLLVLDRVFKHYFFQYGLVELNTGVSFSLFSNSSLVYLSYILALIVLVAYYFLLNHNTKDKCLSIFIILIILSGFNNFIDRVLYGGVVDYLNFYIFKNNLSDVTIFICATYLGYSIFIKKLPPGVRSA